MHPHLIRLLSLSALTVGILAASNGARADEGAAATPPKFSAEPCCNLCPAAHDAKNYTTRYQQNFTTLVQAQGDWLFRTQEDLRTEFDTTPAGYKRMQQLHDAFKAKGVELVIVYQPTRGLVNRNKLNPQEKAAFDFDKALRQLQDHARPFRQDGLRRAGPVAADQRIAAGHPARPRFLLPRRPTLDAIRCAAHGENRRRAGQADARAFADIPKREFETQALRAHGQDWNPAQHGRAIVRHQLRDPVHGSVHHRA
jgi:hypothetical protein